MNFLAFMVQHPVTVSYDVAIQTKGLDAHEKFLRRGWPLDDLPKTKYFVGERQLMSKWM